MGHCLCCGGSLFVYPWYDSHKLGVMASTSRASGSAQHARTRLELLESAIVSSTGGATRRSATRVEHRRCDATIVRVGQLCPVTVHSASAGCAWLWQLDHAGRSRAAALGDEIDEVNR